METQYYLAEKSCSLVLHERLLLAVDGNEVKFNRGETEDRFKVGEDGRPTCLTCDGLSVPYDIIGPLTEEQLRDLSSLSDIYFSRRHQRILSARIDIGGRP